MFSCILSVYLVGGLEPWLSHRLLLSSPACPEETWHPTAFTFFISIRMFYDGSCLVCESLACQRSLAVFAGSDTACGGPTLSYFSDMNKAITTLQHKRAHRVPGHIQYRRAWLEATLCILGAKGLIQHRKLERLWEWGCQGGWCPEARFTCPPQTAPELENTHETTVKHTVKHETTPERFCREGDREDESFNIYA